MDTSFKSRCSPRSNATMPSIARCTSTGGAAGKAAQQACAGRMFAPVMDLHAGNAAFGPDDAAGPSAVSNMEKLRVDMA